MSSEQTATERLRELLDECGVKWWPMYNNGYYRERDTEFVVNGKKHTAHEWGDGLAVYNLTPEQAIAATLGREDTYTREECESSFVRGYSLGSLSAGSDPRWDENRQTVDEHMAELGWVRAATLGNDGVERSNDGVSVTVAPDEYTAKLMAEVERLQGENAKLRELVRISIKYCANGCCSPEDGCPMPTTSDGCLYVAKARELGIEVAE
jgi:hypothetical protein